MRIVSISFFFLAIPLFAAQGIIPDSTESHNRVSRFPDFWFGKDKADHLLVSAFAVGLGYYAARAELTKSDPAAKNIAVGFSLSLGITKEIYDGTYKKSTISYKDLLADILGIGMAYLLVAATTR